MISKYKTIIPAIVGASVFGLAAPAALAAEPADSVNADMVQVAFRQVDKNELLGGVESIDFESLMQKNYINDLNNTTLNGYVSGFNGNSLWGQDTYLVLVDGVPRDMNNIPTTEIKSVSFLKGAQATILYGSRAAKGVILITTKRGHVGPLSIEVRANTGWHVAKSTPEYLGSAEYMTLYNEARANDGLAPMYSADEIYKTAAGVNPYRYPNVDMYSKEFVGHTYNRSDASLQISGGNERARFYTNVNYFRQGDYLKVGEAKDNYTDRFSVRGNVDVNLTDWVSAYVDADATFYGSRSAHGNYWEQAAMFRPNRVAPLIPVDMINPGATGALDLVGASSNLRDGFFFGGTSIDATNIFADYYAKGYNKYTSRQFQFDAGVNLDLGMLLKGLTFGTQFAVDYATSYTTSYTNSYATFVPTWSTQNGYEEIVDVRQEGKDEHSGVQNVSGSTSRQTIHFAGQFDYRRTFADVHNVHALAVAAGWQRTTAAEYHRTSSANLGFEVEYNYDRRYYADIAVAGVHSAKLAPGHRQAWSPSATLGWRLSQEEFLRDSPIVDELMLTVSASNLHSDLDISNYYMYSANYTNGGWYSWAAGGQAAAYPKRGANNDLTFITIKNFNAGVRGKLLNDMIDFNASFFITKTGGLLINNSNKYPTFFSTYYPEASFVPYLNYNDDRRTGFDFGVSFKKQFGDVNFKLGATGTYYTTKATKRDEIYENDYQYRQGKALDGTWGYRCLGFFATDEEAAAANQSALGGSNLQAGDLKYEDVNGDGKIDTNDQVFLGKGGWYGAPFVMGINLTAQWKGFTLFIHGVGNFGSKGFRNDLTASDNETKFSYYWIYGDRKYSAVVRDRWTPETAATATYPRLTTTNGANNFVMSDFWMYDADYFNLAKVQLTYDFPAAIFRDGIVKGLQLYVSGDDLLGIGKNRKFIELNVGRGPQTRFYNFGAKVTF